MWYFELRVAPKPETELATRAAVDEKSYADNPDGLQYFRQAETDSACLVVHEWPVREETKDE